MPIADYGGFRIDTGSDEEIARWVFPATEAGLAQLAHTIGTPGYVLKLCGSADEIGVALPPQWTIQPLGYFMQATTEPPAKDLIGGYLSRVRRNGAVTHAQIFSESGELAADGYAVQTADVFIYDRIVTRPAHRRKGLAKALMTHLHSARKVPCGPEVLVATEAG